MTASLNLGPMGAIAPVVLRPYQETAVADIRTHMQRFRRVLFCLPTGGGKTVVFSFITDQIAERGKSVTILAHRKEIVRQISQALARQGVPHGLIMPGKPMTADPVQVGMIQTCANRLDRLDEPDLLICDEAHHAVAGSWDLIKETWTRAFQLGVTATPERLDGKGLRHAFDCLVLGPTPAELIRIGALADYDYLAPPSDLDLGAVHTRAGDYAQDELEEAVSKSTILGDAVGHYRKYLDGKPAIAFCISVRHAEEVARRFREAGIPAASVDGAMSAETRDDVLAALELGRIKVLTSCDLVSEGFDVPAVAGALLLRPTKSLTLFLQQCGRALRPKADGSKAVILDHVGNYKVHGFPDQSRAWSLDGRPKKKEAPPVTVCKLCFKAMPAPVIHSPNFPCGGVDDEICPYREVKETKGRMIEEVDGELVDARAAAMAKPENPLMPRWAEGVHLAQAKGRDWFRLLDAAGTDLERLKQIEAARGYKRGWARHALAKRYQIETEVGYVLDDVAHPREVSTDALWQILKTDGVSREICQECRIELDARKRGERAA